MNVPEVPQPRQSDQVVAALTGELDLATVGEMKASLAEAATDVGGHVVLDMSAVTFIDAAALGVLVEAANKSQASGGSFGLRNLTPAVERVLRITGLHESLVAKS